MSTDTGELPMADEQPRLMPVGDGHIASPEGFEAAGVACGLKPNGAPDLALVYSRYPCVAAAMFTTNAFKAAPVVYDQNVLARRRHGVHGVVVNSGCANACTGEQGLRDAQATATAAAAALGTDPDAILVMSTGVIGAPLRMDRILAGVSLAVAQRDSMASAGHAAARAIMTTDTRPKELALRVGTRVGEFTIGGMIKGAGMIHPNMATLLCLITTDAPITPALADQALHQAIENSLNMITVDGDTSTNDTVLLLANGQAVLPAITSADSASFRAFCWGLEEVATGLAQAVVRDGEGATRFVTMQVRGARSRAEAKQVAMSVARSLLVKTAIYGRDANWGRIVCAVGYSGVSIDPDRVRIWLGDLELVRHAGPYEIDEERASQILSEPDITVTIDLGLGPAGATVWTCDLSHQYVDINAHYRT